MLRYPQKIKAIEPDNADIRLLLQLVEQRRQLVEDKRRFVNRIINTLQTSLTVRPASTDFNTAIIWCSVNRALRIVISSGNILSMSEDL
ncbi:hypothetical protein PEC106568_43160 [Pectobacterium carotovorum subsp. carotovorum]|nr:hypothetical protein PEC106568_43160 [Pectobacterium carotovorum subsp. carotovorum]